MTNLGSMAGPRALGVIRLSEYALGDSTTSPVRQKEIIQTKADQRGSTMLPVRRTPPGQ